MAKSNIPQSNIGPICDAFGELKAQIAALELKLKPLKDQLASLGQGAYEGEKFRITVSESVRSTLDMEAVRAKLSQQFIRAHTTETEVTSVSAKARTAENVKNADLREAIAESRR